MGAPADELLNLQLPNGWLVKAKIPKVGSTGACHSVGYLVEKEGKTAFLKALDFSAAFNGHDLVRELQAMTTAYNFERDLCFQCKNRRLSRVVHPIEDNSVIVDPNSLVGKVPYIIFELATSDVRKALDASADIDIAWALRTLHQITQAHQQLHGIGIAHQDLKPSNVMMFTTSDARVGDLGNASLEGVAGPFDDLRPAGDPSYAPPEYRWGSMHPDWRSRRFGCDSYLIGSMCVYFFVKASMMSLLLKFVPPQMWPGRWTGTYADILPTLVRSHSEAVQEFGTSLSPAIKEPLVRMVTELCHPDVSQRGDPESPGNMYNLERYLSKFANLATKAEAGII